MIGKQFPVVEDQDGEEEEDGSKEDSVSGSPTDPPLTSIVRIAEREWEVRDQEDSDDPQGDSTGQGESSERFRPAQHNEQGVAGRTDSSYPHRGVEGEDPRSRIPGAKGKEFPVADTIGSSCTGRKSAHTKGSRRSKGKLSIPPDGIDLSEGELEKLQRWSSGALEEVMRFQRRYFKTRLYGSKRDVADRLDPIQSKMVNESRALELMDAYWNHVYPQWAMLDPELHKLAFIRQRSALLTTTLLALGATALSTLPYHTEADVLEAFHLHQHVEKLNVLVFTTGARSIEIVQAHVLLCRFGVAPRTILEEQRWMRAAMIPRMATEIGLHLPKRWKRRRDQQETVQQRELRERMRLNELRTRAFMVINEYRFHVHSGRKLMDLSPLELTSEEIQEITKLGPYHHAVSLPAFYEQYLFGRDVKKRLDTSAESAANDLSLDAELTWIDTYTERWLQDWCPTDGPVKSRWHLVHDALSHQLLLMVNVARRRKTAPLAHAKPDQATKGKAVPGRTSSTSDQERQQQQQQKLLQLAERIFTEALTTPTTTHMTHRASILPFVATIILRLNGRCELILRVALNMAGAPGQRYVPTFVREAGHQMLAMLCVNDARPITSASPQSPQSSRAEKERVLQENPANGNSWPRPPTPLSSNLENIGPAYPEHRGDASAHSAQTTTFYLPVDQRAPELTQGRSPQHDAADGQSGFQFDFASQFPLFPFFSDGSFEFPYTPDSAQWALPASGPTTTFDFLGSELAPSGSSGSDQNFAFQMPSDLDVLLGTMSNGDNGNDLLANNLCVRGEGGTDLFSSTWPGLPQGSNKSDASPWSDHPAASASGPPSTQQVPTMPLPDTAAHNTGFHNDLGMLNAVDTMAHSPQATFNPSWLVDALRLANSNANTTSGSARGDGNSSQGNYRQVLTDAAVQLIQLASSVQ
ncbi:hypothetical protein I317_05077 [Kwoniella heveanensis CBS 569]|nr:hypothetical protein I317_05077 [Kwoniella heveanensis CBS 569]